jgi:endo-1,4-beta-xylanase
LLPGETQSFMENVDPTNACFFVGASQPFLLIPETAEFNASASSTVSNGNNGSITLSVEGGLAALVGDPSFYSFSWTGPNGFTATTQNLSGLAPGAYTVEIRDLLGGCTPPFSLTVSVTSDVDDPAFVRNLAVFPNPTTGLLNLDLNLEQAVELQVEVYNAMGQMVQQINAGNVSSYTKALDLSAFSNGIYLIRFRLDGETAVRRVTIQK